MKFVVALVIALVIAAATLGCTSKQEDHPMNTRGQHTEHQPGHEHPHGAPGAGAHLMVATNPSRPEAGRPVKLELMIHNAEGAPVRDFDVMHEQKVHLAIISEGLDHFAHIHPVVFSSGNLIVAHTFPAGGGYRLFADYAPAGGEPATATGSLSVGGRSLRTTAPVPNAPGEVEADGLHATISADRLTAGSPARLAFTLRNDRGEPVTLEPYMGELGHLMLVGVGTWRYVHVHPTGGVADRGFVEFGAQFPEPGIYKGWGQVKHGGKARVIPFVVQMD
jgi:hypothetical protein